MKIGDKVKVRDGSYAVRVDQYEEYPSIGFCEDVFKIVEYGADHLKSKFTGLPVHDIYIQNTVDGKIYLHSKYMVRVIPDTPKKLTKGTIVINMENGDEYMVCLIDCDTNILIAMTGFDVGNRWNRNNIKTTADLPRGFEVKE